MPDTSQLLSLPYIQASQAQKHVTHNEGMRILDSLVQIGVVSTSLGTPPASPVPGDRYIVGAGATGDWIGHDLALAVYDENNWRFFEPATGWLVWDAATTKLLSFDGSGWVEAAGIPDQVPLLGINTAADTTNRLSVASDASLFSHDGSDHRMKLNKASTPDTASLLFQTNWVGHAELGLTGSNDLEFKTSDDGVNFNTALHVDAATGEVSFPSGVQGLGGPALDILGDGPLVARGYSSAKGPDYVANGTGLMGTNYNMPDEFDFDGSVTPNLPGSFRYSGYGGGFYETAEFIGLDPNKV